MILAGGVDSAPPRGTQGMKGPWAIGLTFLIVYDLFGSYSQFDPDMLMT